MVHVDQALKTRQPFVPDSLFDIRHLVAKGWLLLLRILFVLASSILLPAQPTWAQTSATSHYVHVQMPPVAARGRLLVFLTKATEKNPVLISFEDGPTNGQAVAALEVGTKEAGERVDVDVEGQVYPLPFSKMPSGEYVVQAFLDTGGSYGQTGATTNDWMSSPTPVRLPFSGDVPLLKLSNHPPSRPWDARATAAVASGQIEEFRVVSPLLTRFFGSETAVAGSVVLPPGYDSKSKTTYPTVYWNSGYSGSHLYDIFFGTLIRKRMDAGTMPPMIWVMLDQNWHTGTQEFADSVNNGPWGAALTSEVIPELERRYRMDARPSGRLLNGHSSGGWASMHLQIDYPRIFGGTWSTSPDPVDFHDFLGVNLYAPNANLFHDAEGRPRSMMRDGGKSVFTIEEFSQLEDVLGAEGGQMASFEWVFSPRGSDGLPLQMYDRATGNVDAKVVQYWHDHYDLTADLERRWHTDRAALVGKIHVYVGTADTFYLDGPVHLLDAALIKLKAQASVHYVPGRTHVDLYTNGKDTLGLFDELGAEMYTVARPGTKWLPRSAAQ